MKFKRIDVETVRCLISEEELNENGLNLDDFLQNGKKTEDFLRKIVTLAAEEVDYKVPGGSLSIQASVLPDHILALTFSEKQDGGILGLLENLKSAVSRFSDSVKEVQESVEEKQGKVTEPRPIQAPSQEIYEMEFSEMDNIMRYAKAVSMEIPVENVLYKLEKTGKYYLVLRKGDMTDKQLCKLLSAALDFAETIFSDLGMLAYMDEHGEKIISKDALQVLQTI